MKRVRGGQFPTAHLSSLQEGRELLDFVTGSSHHISLVAVHRREIKFVRENVLQFIERHGNRQHRSGLAHLHQTAANRDQLEAIIQRVDPAQAGGDELTQRVAEHRRRFETPRFKLFRQCILDHEKCGLSHRSLRKLRLCILQRGTIAAVHAISQIQAEFTNEEVRAIIKNLPIDLLVLVQTLPHPHGLRPLSRKHEHDGTT